MKSGETTTDVREAAARATIEPKISHALVLTGAQVAHGLGRMLFVVVVARTLGPQQFGVYALLLAVVEMLAVASGTGYGDYLTREAAKDPRAGWGLGEQLTWLRLACVLPLAGSALGVLWVLGYARMVLVAGAWLAVTLIPRSVSEAVQGVLRGVGHYKAYLVVELVFDLGLVAGALWILTRGGALTSAIEAEVIAAMAAALVSLFFTLLLRTKERIFLGGRQLLRKSAIFNIYAFVVNLYDRLDVVLLSKLGGNYATGIYSAAYRPLGTVQLVPYGVLYSLLPALSRNAGGAEERQRLERAMGFLLSFAFAVVLSTMVFAGPAVRLVLGQPFAESAVALKILIWAVILRYVNYALNVQLLASGHERVFVVTSLVCLGVNVIGNLLLIPIYSWRAAAALTIVTEFALLAQNVYWLHRTHGVTPRPFRWVRTSLVFAALLSTALGAGKVASPVAVGSACLFFFLIYLYRTGMVGEFAAAWGAQQSAGGL